LTTAKKNAAEVKLNINVNENSKETKIFSVKTYQNAMFVQNGPFWVLLSLFPVVSYNIGSKDISISGLAVTYYFQLTVFR